MAVSGDNYVLQTGTNAIQDCSQRIVARDKNSGTKIEKKHMTQDQKIKNPGFTKCFFRIKQTYRP